jgi:hypothetical protein
MPGKRLTGTDHADAGGGDWALRGVRVRATRKPVTSFLVAALIRLIVLDRIWRAEHCRDNELPSRVIERSALFVREVGDAANPRQKPVIKSGRYKWA